MTEADARPAPRSPYEALGGAATFRAIVDRFYDLMESEPSYGPLRAMHGDDLAPMREALASFLGGWAGGPREWFDANPGRCMFSVHGGFAIDAETANQWADAMARAIAESDIADRDLAAQLSDRLTGMARGMARNVAA
ncbi:globin [Croceicoccus ponticola]|uniref:Globin n=1 Tax=Croceicoccus ponticola TaxID=2217664 RepID=A0A437GYI2_9SPHN|nr:group II truncated hemoglobin [Croceicoccus ponticola]RVQ67731.1 globin [Croceicoccus ponticola]